MPTRRHAATLLATGLALLATSPVLAQDYPAKPITIVVGYPPGGSTDLMGRLVGAELSTRLGQPVVIENLGGAGGTIAAQKVLSSPTDGAYSLLGSPNEVILSPMVLAGVKFKAEDFRLVHPVSRANMVFVARKDLPVNSVDELIALARKSKDKPLTYGSFLQAEVDKWAKVVKTSGAKID